jgi:hypothetical protein
MYMVAGLLLGPACFDESYHVRSAACSYMAGFLPQCHLPAGFLLVGCLLLFVVGGNDLWQFWPA